VHSLDANELIYLPLPHQAYVFTVVEFSGLMSSCLFLLLSISSTVILILYKVWEYGSMGYGSMRE
jgi:hypothetical protein